MLRSVKNKCQQTLYYPKQAPSHHTIKQKTATSCIDEVSFLKSESKSWVLLRSQSICLLGTPNTQRNKRSCNILRAR